MTVYTKILKLRATLPLHTPKTPKHYLLQIRRRQALNNTSAIHEPRPEYPVRILEHAILERHHDELRSMEPRLDQPTDILRVREVQGGVDLVQNVHGCRLELQEGEDEGEGDQGSSRVEFRSKYGVREMGKVHTFVHRSAPSDSASRPCPAPP